MNRVLVGLVLLSCGCSATSPGRDGGAGGAGGAGADAGTTPYAPELTAVVAQVSGRTGRDLRFSVSGKDRNLEVAGLRVRLTDDQGAPVIGVDTDGDGVPDSAEGSLALESPKWVGEKVTATATLRHVFDHGLQVAKAAVVLEDSTNLRSAELSVAVLPQPVKALGQTCDPLFAADRCATSLGCRGAPPSCQEGLAPTIGRLAFYRGVAGPTILLDGLEPEDDLATVRFEFQNPQGQMISIDSDGDGIPDLTSFDLDANGAAVDGAFFIRMQAGDGLDQQVAKLVATPRDLAGHTGAVKTAAPMAAPVRGAGQACDPRGFDVCASGQVCSPGVVGQANRCTAGASLRATQCTAAPVLVATAAGATAIGHAEGASLWDAPAGCSSADPKGRPEGLVTVRLAQRANKLTLSTAHPGTNFDTTLYVFQGCPPDSSGAFDCSDDAAGLGSASKLVLQDLPAGDYLVVVDSFDFVGGTFELSAAVE